MNGVEDRLQVRAGARSQHGHPEGAAGTQDVGQPIYVFDHEADSRSLACLVTSVLCAPALAGTASIPEETVSGRIIDVTCFGPCAPGTNPKPFEGHADIVVTQKKTGDQVARVSVKGSKYSVLAPPGRYRIVAIPFPEQDSNCWVGELAPAGCDCGPVGAQAPQGRKRLRSVVRSTRLRASGTCPRSSGSLPRRASRRPRREARRRATRSIRRSRATRRRSTWRRPWSGRHAGSRRPASGRPTGEASSTTRRIASRTSSSPSAGCALGRAASFSPQGTSIGPSHASQQRPSDRRPSGRRSAAGSRPDGSPHRRRNPRPPGTGPSSGTSPPSSRLVDEEDVEALVLPVGEKDAARRQPVAPSAPGLLVVGLERRGNGLVDHGAHVRLVDAHAERVRRHDHGRLA